MTPTNLAIAALAISILIVAAICISEILRHKRIREDEERIRRGNENLLRAIMLAGPPAGAWFAEAKHPLDSVSYDIRKLN